MRINKYIAEKHPDMYSEIATNLYHIGRHEATRLSLPSSMRHITHNDLEQAGISIVDAIMQGAITKSNNICNLRERSYFYEKSP